MTTPRPILFLAFANDRDDRARTLRNLAEEARQVQRALAAAEQYGHCELVTRQNTPPAPPGRWRAAHAGQVSAFLPGGNVMFPACARLAQRSASCLCAHLAYGILYS